MLVEYNMEKGDIGQTTGKVKYDVDGKFLYSLNLLTDPL